MKTIAATGSHSDWINTQLQNDPSSSAGTLERPPNILLLASDEHRADTAGYTGNGVIRTPTLDRLASTGAVFDAAYSPSPICVPARQCLACGQLPSTCGVRRYGQDLPPFSMTFARWLVEHGYYAAACGKLHHMGPDQMQGWCRRVGMDHMCETEAPQSEVSGLRRKWSDAKEVRRAGVGSGPTTHAWDDYALDGFRRLVNELLIDPHYDKARPDQPMLLYLGLNNPHYPYFADEASLSYYLNRVTPYTDQTPFPHPWLGRTANPEGDTPFVAVGDTGQVSHRDVRRATAAYYANVERIDTQFGQALDALVHAGQDTDDWLIIYFSDHGEMLGQHAIWEKQKFFEGSVRVPLIVRWPRRLPPRRVAENVSLCDLFATLCDAAGIATPPEERCVNGRPLDSRSLLGLAEGNAAGWDNLAVSEFNGTDLMVKLGQLKYQRYDRPECRDEPEVLFDLSHDSSESCNLIAEPGYAEALKDLRRVANGLLKP